MQPGRRLPARLRSLVRVVETALGDVIREAEGAALFTAIEEVRRSMLTFRGARQPAGRRRALRAAARRLGRVDRRERTKLARAYTLYLELVNAAENAYRTHRLGSRHPVSAGETRPADVVFVLTAHPTESRSPQNIGLLRRVEEVLRVAADHGGDPDPRTLRYLIHLLWRVGTHAPDRPSVVDEARHLYSLLSDPILEELIDLARSGRSVRLRTWVGGDKDGHPGVGVRETAQSLQLSRDRLLEFVRRRVASGLTADAALLDDRGLAAGLERLLVALGDLERVRPGDGARVKELGLAVRRLDRLWRARCFARHPLLERLEVFLDRFPGLVVPLELREERGCFAMRRPIASMLRKLVAVARGGKLESYVGGLVVSMAREPRDILEACALVEQVAGGPRVPVIPLFELPETLEGALGILDGVWEAASFRRALRGQRRRLEVMLGYSDTAKRMGVLASRLAIGQAMQAIGTWARRRRLGVVFFHGSGGSVGRGGGTFADRAAGWPRDFLSPHKETLQGEMVERTLATPEILRSNVTKIAAMQHRPPRFVPPGELVTRLAVESGCAFAELVATPELRALLAGATPYERLGSLTIGSRPPKRGSGGAALDELRAIPWVLCWTQTRYLLHAWLGIGTAWRRIRRERGAVARLRKAMRDDPFLRAYMRTLGFTMAKTAPSVWREYVRVLAPAEATGLVRRLEREFEDALDLARQASPDGELLHDRRWLLESIRHRAPMIHPLNLLQIGALERCRAKRSPHDECAPGNRSNPSKLRDDDELFRETVTGIAAGMLTTG